MSVATQTLPVCCMCGLHATTYTIAIEGSRFLLITCMYLYY